MSDTFSDAVALVETMTDTELGRFMRGSLARWLLDSDDETIGRYCRTFICSLPPDTAVPDIASRGPKVPSGQN